MLPANVMRFTKYCGPSCTVSVTSTTGGGSAAEAAAAAASAAGIGCPGCTGFGIRVIGELEVRIAVQLPVAADAVGLLHLLVALDDLLVAVVIAGLNLKSVPERLAPQHLVAVEVERRRLCSACLPTTGIRSSIQRRLLVLAVLERLHLGFAEVGPHVPLIPVVLGHPLGVFLELVGMIRARRRDEAKTCPSVLLCFICLRSCRR